MATVRRAVLDDGEELPCPQAYILAKRVRPPPDIGASGRSMLEIWYTDPDR